MDLWSFVPCAMVWVVVIFSLVIFLPVSLDIKVMVTVIVALVLHLLQRFMVPMRRFSEEFIIQYAAMAAYYLPSVLAIYTANSMLSSCYHHNFYYVIWCVCLLIFSSQGTTEMKIYSLSAPGDQQWRLLQLILYLTWLQWGLVWSTGRTLIVLVALTVYSLWTTMVWLFTMLLFNKPRVGILDDNSKAFADYMRQEYKTLFDERADAAAKYPVMQAHDGEMITVSKIFLKQPDMAEYRDNFLSYSFCQLLARRYFGFHCAEEGSVKVRDFALTELLPSDQDYKKAFRVTEVQLAFLHDYLFTNFHRRMMLVSTLYMQPIRVLRQSILLPALVLAPLGVVACSLMLFVFGGTFETSKIAFHAVASLLLAVRALFILKPGLPGYWQRVWTFFQIGCGPARVEATSVIEQLVQLSVGPVIERIIKLFLSPHWSCSSSMQPYWQEKLGQYSIIQDYDSCSPKKAVIAWFKEQILCEVSHNIITHRPVEDESVSLTDDSGHSAVKERVARTLRRINGPPTNGKNSLLDNRVLETFKWTLNAESHTHTVLIWHIATSYYDMFSKESKDTPDHHVALTLSRYCAYLVAFHPELLPDHSLHAKTVLQEVLQEARDSLALTRQNRARVHQTLLPVSVPLFLEDAHVPLLGNFVQDWRTRLGRVLQDCWARLQQILHPAKRVLGLARTPMEEKKPKIQEVLQSLTGDVDRLKTFQKGIKLGQQLVDRDSSARDANHKGSWEAMADFWAETILYIAPSDNAAAHIELLAQGGQFVTHLWALLANAGIFKRETEEISQRGPVPAGPASY